jgi:hypothetical protein
MRPNLTEELKDKRYAKYPNNRLIYMQYRSLKEDLISILEFDYLIEKYCAEPVTIELNSKRGIEYYTPDFVFFYNKEREENRGKKPVLCEVLSRENFWKNWKEKKPKYKAAINYAENKGWQFKIFTEKEIRTDLLHNINFLNNFRNLENQYDDNNFKLILFNLDNLGMSTPEKVIAASSKNKEQKAELTYTLWCMVALNFIQCDLTKKLTMESDIWIDI